MLWLVTRQQRGRSVHCDRPFSPKQHLLVPQRHAHIYTLFPGCPAATSIADTGKTIAPKDASRCRHRELC